MRDANDYARQRLIVTPDKWNTIALRENKNMDAFKSELLRKQHPGGSFGANLQTRITARVLFVMKWREVEPYSE